MSDDLHRAKMSEAMFLGAVAAGEENYNTLLDALRKKELEVQKLMGQAKNAEAEAIAYQRLSQKMVLDEKKQKPGEKRLSDKDSGPERLKYLMGNYESSMMVRETDDMTKRQVEEIETCKKDTFKRFNYIL